MGKINNISKEIKSKLFAQYLGQKILIPKVVDSKEHWFCTPSTILNIDVGLKDYNGTVLVLKPLSNITSEEAIEVTKLQQEWKSQKDIKISFFIDEKNNGCLDCCIEWEGYEHDYYQPIYTSSYQYLQSKGYDLPQYLLGGKTLVEVGLATNPKQQTDLLT